MSKTEGNNHYLYRVGDSILGGVCAGLADYLSVDVSIVRIFAVVLCVLTLGFAGIVYLILWGVLPVCGSAYARDAVQVETYAAHSEVHGHNVEKDCEAPSNPDRVAHVALAIGVAVLVVVIAMLLSHGSLFHEPLHFWPLSIIAAGIVRMVLPDASGQRLWPFAAGAGLVVLGLVTLLDSLAVIVVNWSDWLLNGTPMLIFAAVFYIAGMHWKVWWAKLAAFILVAVFFLIGFAMYVEAGPIQQLPLSLLVRIG